MTTALYLLPVPLGDTPHSRVLPDYNREVILSIRHFVVENVRTARRFLKKVEPSIDIDALTFSELNKHTAPEVVAGYLAPLERDESVGVISEAGCPAVADPGADVVAIAQRKEPAFRLCRRRELRDDKTIMFNLFLYLHVLMGIVLVQIRSNHGYRRHSVVQRRSMGSHINAFGQT